MGTMWIRACTWVVLVVGACALLGVARAQEVDAGLTAPPSATEVASPGSASSDTAPPAAAASDDAVLTDAQETVLRTTHIGELAEQTRVALRQARVALRPNEDADRIERHLSGAEAEVASMAIAASPTQVARLSQRELAELQQEWQAYRERLDGWNETLSAYSTELEAGRLGLVELGRTWSALRDASEAAGRLEARRERIESSIAALRAADDELDAHRDDVVGFEDRVSELILVTDDVTDRIREGLLAYRNHLWVPDRAPLWQGIGADVIGDDDETLAEHLATQLPLIAAQRPAHMRLAALAVLLAGLLVLARRRVASLPEDAHGTFVRGIVTRPLKAALLAALLASPIVVGHAPVLFEDVMAVVVLVPLLVVVMPIVPRSMHSLLWLVASFVLVDRIEGVMSDGSAARRVVVLVESIIVAAGLAAWVRGNPDVPGGLAPAARALSVSSSLVLVLALIANAFGFLFLATVLVRGTAFALGWALQVATAIALVDAFATLALGSALVRRSHALRLHETLVLMRVRRAARVLGVLAWVLLTLGGYGLATPFLSWAEDVLTRRREIGTLDVSLGDVTLALLVLAATWATARFVRFVLELDVLPRVALEPGVDGAISGLTRYVIVATGILFSLAVLGIDASQIALVAGALGVGIGFGLQGIVANFIAGLVLMLERPVRLGDRIEVGSLLGRVERIGLRSSTVRGEDGAEVIVPNDTLIGREVVNWTLSDRKRRMRVSVGVAYGTDPKRVIEVLTAAVRGHVGVLGAANGASEPTVEFRAFGASSLDFVVEFWTEEHGMPIVSAIGLAVHDALVAAGIEIPFPQQDVHVKSLPANAASATTS